MNANHWIQRLNLQRHPEGGWYRETWRSPESVQREHLPERFTGPRHFSTAIYYLLEQDDFSAFHRLKQEECWHHYDGGTIELHLISPEGKWSQRRLGKNLDAGEEPQIMVASGWWFAATVASGAGYCLSGCTVAPGFDFADFEMPTRAELIALFPQYAKEIEKRTRG
jgi:hypothetical protein